MIFSFYIYSQYLVMIIIPYISIVLSTLRQAAHTQPPQKKKKKEKQWQPPGYPKNNGSPLDTLPNLLISYVHLCAISYWQPCVYLECTSDQMLQEQITWSKIPTSEINRYILYKILIVDCTVPRFFQMSPTFWRVGAPGPQNWNSWLEHCHHSISWTKYQGQTNELKNTIFDLITAHNPISAKSRNSVVFRLQPVYFFLPLYKGICCGYSFELHQLVDAIQMSTHNIMPL